MEYHGHKVMNRYVIYIISVGMMSFSILNVLCNAFGYEICIVLLALVMIIDRGVIVYPRLLTSCIRVLYLSVLVSRASRRKKSLQ